MKFFTFYSYKGGVGRSMALANIAKMFYRSGKRVLMVDWDLEAPGLERFFYEDPSEVLKHRGLIDLILQYKENASHEVDEDEPFPLGNLKDYIIDLYPGSGDNGKLFLLPAGKRQGAHFSTYAQSVLSFDWQDFYENWEGERYLEWLREQFENLADIILIDSRTGVTEMTGVCTYQMADTVIMFCASNQQNIDGIYNVASTFTSPEVKELRIDRPLDIIVVPARLEDRSEHHLLNSFRIQFEKRFDKFVPQVLRPVISSFWDLKIPYIPYYSFNETLITKEQDKDQYSEDLIYAFRFLSVVIAKLANISEPIEYGMDELEDRLIKLMNNIPALENEKGRDWLLRNLPEKPVAIINRGESQYGDISAIVTNVRKWGWLPNGKHALELVIENTKEFVRGLLLEEELNYLNEELKSALKKAKLSSVNEPAHRVEVGMKYQLELEKMENQLIEHMIKIPALEDKQNRDMLLRNLPPKPIAAISRGRNKDADITTIITNIGQWGRLATRKHALEIVIDNAKEFVEGLLLEKDLNDLKSELISLFTEEERYEMNRLSDKESDDKDMIAPQKNILKKDIQEDYQYPFRFIGREFEIKDLTGQDCPQFVLFDAPACFGKTFLLKHTEKIINTRRKKQEEAICLYINVKELKPEINDQNNNRRYFLEKILNKMQLLLTSYNNPKSQSSEEELITSITTNFADPENDLYRVIFIFDSLEVLQTNNEFIREDDFKDFRNWFWQKFIINLTELLNQRKITFQGVFAGRYIRHEFKGRWRRLIKVRHLSPLDVYAIQKDVIKNYTSEKPLTPDVTFRIAHEVFDLTGGHPKCIIQIIDEIKERNFTVEVREENHDFYFFNEKRKIQFIRYVEIVLEDIFWDIDAKVYDALYIISAFRCFNIDTLTLLINKGFISGFNDSSSLLIELMKTHLVQEPSINNPFFSGHIVRSMLSSLFKVKDKRTYYILNQLGCKFYENLITRQDFDGKITPQLSYDFRLVCLREALYHHVEKMLIKKTNQQESREKLTDIFRMLLESLKKTMDAKYFKSRVFGINDSDLEEKIVRVSGEDGYDNLLDMLDR